MNQKALITIKNLTVGYPERVVVSGVEMELFPGEIAAFIGPNGVGKTTLLRTVAGLLAPLSGSVFYDGMDLKELSAVERAKTISVCLTERMNAEWQTCFEVVGLGRYPYTGRFGRLTERDRQIVLESLQMVGMEDVGERLFSNLSDGQKQLVLLARAFAQEPQVLILDEPTSYLDVSHKWRFAEILKEYAHEKNITVMTSLHELELAWMVSDRIFCLSGEGKIAASGTPAEVFSSGEIGELFGMKEEALKSWYRGFSQALS